MLDSLAGLDKWAEVEGIEAEVQRQFQKARSEPLQHIGGLKPTGTACEPSEYYFFTPLTKGSRFHSPMYSFLSSSSALNRV